MIFFMVDLAILSPAILEKSYTFETFLFFGTV
jgi:hypothetical protein